MNKVKMISSNIDFISYKESEQELYIWFKGRKNEEEHYIFKNVPVTVFGEFMTAESKGGYFHKNLRNRYDVEKVEDDIN